MRNREQLSRYQNLRNSEVPHDLALTIATIPSGETAVPRPGTEAPEPPLVPSPDGAIFEWLDDMIRDVDDAATRLKRLAERLRET